MQSRRKPQASVKRRGFTLIELLVVISIIAVLMSLILPAVQNAREAGRRTQCLNNIRNVTLAAVNFSTTNKNRLPALAYFPVGGGSAARINGRSWAVELLPYMDNQSTYDRWNKDVAFNAPAATPGGFSNAALGSELFVEAFVCPNDESAQRGGGLTYMANAGFGTHVAAADISNDGGALQHSPLVEPFNWNGNSAVNGMGTDANADPADTEITKSTSVFVAEFEGVPGTRNSSVAIGKIYDGNGNTLMFGENINGGGVTWADPRTRACAFMLPLDPMLVGPGTMGNVPAAVPPGLSPPPFPNDAKVGPEGAAPYLNSNHPGIVVVSFCDGAAKAISEDIDQNVYASLITPGGTRLKSIPSYVPEAPVSGDSF